MYKKKTIQKKNEVYWLDKRKKQEWTGLFVAFFISVHLPVPTSMQPLPDFQYLAFWEQQTSN